eukprot:2902180-Ditylum_brightwellii.AAC.1
MVPNKFREHAHTMFQIGVDFPAYAQCHVSKGLKVFGKEGTEAGMSELKQLHKRSVLDPKDPDE